MANTKLTELTTAGTPAEDNLLYLVQSSNSRKITLEALFAAIPVPMGLTKPLSLGGTPQTLTETGDVDLETSVTLVEVGADEVALTLAAGAVGQVKIIVISDRTGIGDVTLAATFVEDPEGGQILISGEKGTSVVLLYTSAGWVILSYRQV